MMRRYYESDAGYPPRTLLPRSHQTSRSRVPSLRSVSSSSKRSSFLGGFFAPSVHQQQHSDKNGKTVECVVCLDDLPANQAPKLKCGHRMCKTCLKRVFKISIKDPQQMPPRCCTSECIPLKHVDKLFKDDFKRIWNRKFAEFSTRNRVYCPGKKCGEWIKPDQIHRHRNGRKIAKCSKCGTRVCCACNNKWHESRHCPMDEETDQVLQQAKEHGWQRCFNCNSMVELKEGCNHMTCRCNAEFCMICGSKWKTCECPWFSYDTAEQDGLDDMEIPVPMVDRDRLGGSDTLPRDFRAGATTGQSARFRPNTYEEEMHYRHLQEQQDEELARRLQYEDTDDEYLDGMGDGMGDVIGVGNAAGHFMNDNYRRAQSVITPQHPPAAPFERANSTVTDYVAGVNRSRGVRASSMERRLADRFEQRQGNSPTHRSFGHPIPPPPHPPRSMGPPPPPQPPGMPGMHGMPGMPGSGLRRHTLEDDIYDNSRNPRLAERMAPRRAATHDYLEEVAMYAPTSRRRHREREPPRDSVLAGLNGQGRGMNRVFEWRNYVEPAVGPEHHITAS
ncbi:hypothetical protein F5X99DRAFT_134957 [Biscogniauxia marginata]|nr:hypothetical protein F5X99DRAFT_134957 [Biscogniauxia marginata]